VGSKRHKLCVFDFIRIMAFPADVLLTLKMMVVGHSYITRMDHFLSQVNNLDLAFFRQWSHFSVEFCGLPGATIFSGRKCLHSLLPQILQKKPDVVFLQIGENDISNGHRGVGVAAKIVDVVQLLLNDGVSRVVVGQLLPFPRLIDLGKRNEIIAANCELKRRLASIVGARLWQHRFGAWSSIRYRELFTADRVHLSVRGQTKFASSIHGALMKAITAAAFQQCSAEVAEPTPEMEMVELNVPMDMPNI